jgi:hypothetical protein
MLWEIHEVLNKVDTHSEYEYKTNTLFPCLSSLYEYKTNSLLSLITL